ncbi:MAG: hypothetical protein HYS27_24010 [Deltaproteobacteria bacterium]|nr:hypothetical protein [Deltaproteobacteria bacterium]
MRWTAPAFVLVLLAACYFDAAVPPAAKILCQSDDQCPTGRLCRVDTGQCIDSGAINEPDPRLLDGSVEPAVAGRGTVLHAVVVVEGALAAPPEVVLAVPGQPRAFQATDDGFTLALVGDEPEGTLEVAVTLRGANGVDVEDIPIGAVRVDRTAPVVIRELSALTLSPPAGTLVAVESVGRGTQVQVAFVPDEPVAASPTVTALSPGGEALAFTVLPDVADSRAVRAAVVLPEGAAVEQGRWTVRADLVDEAGNRAEAEVGVSFVVDTEAPTPLTAAQRARYVYRRSRYGEPLGDGLPRFTVAGTSVGAAEPGAWVAAFDVDEIAFASMVGVGRADAEGRVPEFVLSRSNRPVVYLAQIDAAGNLEGAVAGVVGLVDFVVASGGRVVGGSLANPHRFALRDALDVGVRLEPRELEIAAGELRLADGAPLRVEGSVERSLAAPVDLRTVGLADDGGALVGLQATAGAPAGPGRTVAFDDQGLRVLATAPQLLTTATRPAVLWDAPRGRLLAVTGARALTTCDYGIYDCCDEYCDDVCCDGSVIDAARGPDVWVRTDDGWRALPTSDREGDGEPGPSLECCTDVRLEQTTWFDGAARRVRAISTNGVFELDDDDSAGSWRRIAGPLPPGTGQATLDPGSGRVFRHDNVRTFEWSVGAPTWTQLVTTDPEGDGNPAGWSLFVDDAGALRTIAGPYVWTRTDVSWRRSPLLALAPTFPVAGVATPLPGGTGALVADGTGAAFRVRGDAVELVAPRLGAGGETVIDRFASVASASRRYLLGGRNSAGAPARAVSSWSGSGADPVSAQGAPRFADAAAALDELRARAVLFGGALPDGTLDATTRILDLASGALTALPPAAPASTPPARARASAGFSPAAGAVVLFGGQGAAGLLDDTWLLDAGDSWRPAALADPEGDGSPPPRAGAHVVVDAVDGLVLCGGWDGGWLLDRWAFTGASWARLPDDDDDSQRARLVAAWAAEPMPLPPTVVRLVDGARPPALVVTLDLDAAGLDVAALEDVVLEGAADGDVELFGWDGVRFASLKRGALPLAAPARTIDLADFTVAIGPVTTTSGARPRRVLDALGVRLRYRLVAP